MKHLLPAAIMLICITSIKAQSDDTASIKRKDSTIMADIVKPAVMTAIEEKSEPDWDELAEEITVVYNDYYAERLVTKGKIYFYFVDNKPAFLKALIQFTEKYEDKNNLVLMNKNANYVLQYSTDKEELKTAAAWSKRTVDNEPANQTYQATYKALLEKIQ